MRKLVESTFVTLDGVIGSPQNWSGPYWDDQHAGYAGQLLERAGGILLGRQTYDVFAASWPERAGDPYADRLNAMPKYVASRTMADGDATWNNTTVLHGDVPAEVKRLKDEDGGDLLKFGSGVLDAALIEHGLVDEFHFWVFPVVAGTGDRLLDGVVELTHLELVDTTVFRSGIVVHICSPK